jgi:hypothetical protein
MLPQEGRLRAHRLLYLAARVPRVRLPPDLSQLAVERYDALPGLSDFHVGVLDGHGLRCQRECAILSHDESSELRRVAALVRVMLLRLLTKGSHHVGACELGAETEKRCML